MHPLEKAAWVILFVAAGLQWQLSGGSISPISTPKASQVVYIYEKDDGDVPKQVEEAINKLNRKGITASSFEEDTLNGLGQTPAQYVVPLAAAREKGLPALTVGDGKTVSKVVKAPKTEEEVLKAVE